MGRRRGPDRAATVISGHSAGKIIESSADIACVVGFDGRILEVNASFVRELGDLVDEMGSLAYVDLIHPGDRDETLRRTAALTAGGLKTIEIENRVRGRDGVYQMLRWHFAADRGAELLYGLAQRNVSRKVALGALDTDAHYSLMFDATDAIAVTDAGGAFTYISPACLPLLGYAPQELIGRPVATLIHPEDRALAGTARRQAAHTPDAQSVSLRYRRKDGSYAWIESRSKSVFDPITGALCETEAVMRDISERKEAQLAIERQALTDALTGLANRMLLPDRLRQGLKRLRRSPGLVGVLMLDLDHFKVINDTLGHQIGDAVLVAAANRLQSLARPDDTVVRFGGDEFVVVVQSLKKASDLTAFADRIVTGLREPYQIAQEDIVTTVSVGIAATSLPEHSPADLLREADLALYQAKDRGRDRHEVYGEALQVRAVARLETERLIRRGMAKGQLAVEYQPIVDLSTGTIVEAEALLRIDGNDHGRLVPTDFLSVAEESGLLPAMDEWVRATALTQFAAWRSNPDLRAIGRVAVNVTARDLASSEFASRLAVRLREADLEGCSLALEVTEHALLQTSHSAMSSLVDLRRLGVHIGLDDFGTGFSALSYLQTFPLDYLKIDQTFVNRIASDRRSSSIIAAVIDLAHALDLAVVAEGIETEDQLTILRSLGCDRGQGFVFSRPVTAADFADILRAQHT